MRFETTCLMSEGKDIQALKASSTKVTRATFTKHVDKMDRESLENRLGYRTARSGSIRSWNASRIYMTKDPHVSYYKGTYRGKPCYFFVWSGIEHIFTEQGAGL